MVDVVAESLQILYIEDNNQNFYLVEFILKAKGYAVHRARDGMEGISLAKSAKPDLILLDIRMPVMSGVEFAAEYIARYGNGPKAPIVVMTAAEHVARRSHEIGADDFLPKPFSPEELVDVVKAHTERPAPPPATGA